jgi:ribosomal-protein-alanine N-acetyltransferase
MAWERANPRRTWLGKNGGTVGVGGSAVKTALPLRWPRNTPQARLGDPEAGCYCPEAASPRPRWRRRAAELSSSRSVFIVSRIEIPRHEPLQIQVRWMIRRDMPEVLEIEQASFEFPWSEEDFTECLRQRNCIGMVAEMAESVVAFMIYELHRSRLHVLNFAVRRSHRRLGIGRQMIERLVGKLSGDRRDRILLEVRERNLPAQLFFRDSGFMAVSVLKNFYQDSTEDAYQMQYLLPADVMSMPRRKAG